MNEAFIKPLLLLTGAVATVLGTLGVVRGVDDVRGPSGKRAQQEADTWLANVDSEFRFFAAWYAAVGTQMTKAALTADPERRDLGWIGAAWLGSATGRALSIRSRGRPHALYLVLMGLEVIVGILLCGQARRSPPPGSVTSADPCQLHVQGGRS